MPFLSETASIKTASSSSTTPKSPTVNISETPLAEVKVVDGKIYPDVSELNLEESFPHLSLDCSLDNPYFWEELSLQNQIRKEDILSILMNIRQMDTLMSEKIQFDSAVALMNFAKNNTRLRDELVLVDACQDVLTLFCQLNRTRTMLLVDPSADEANSVHKEDTTATNVDDPSSSLKTILALITVHLLESKQSILDLTPVKVKAIRTCLRYLEVIDVDTIEIKSVFMRCHSKELHQLAKEGRQRLEKRIERMPFYEPNSMQYRNDHEIRALLLLWEAETLSLKVEPQSVKKRGNTVPHTTAVLLQPGKENDSYYIAELSAKLAGCKTEEDKFNVKHVLRNLDIVLAVVNRALMFFFDMPGFDPRKDKVGQYYIDFATRDVDLITLIQIIQDISIARGLRVLAALTFAFCIPMQIKSSSMAPQDSIMCLNFLASCEESYLEESFLVLMPNRDSLLKITRQEVQAAIFCGLERCDKSIVELLHYREKSAELEESEAELIRLRKYLEELGKKGDFIPILSHLAASLSNRKRFEVADFILVNICSLKNFDLINKLVKCKGIHILLLVYASKDTDSQTRSVLAQAVCILLTGNKAPPAFQTLSMEIWILDCFNYLQLNGHSGYVRVTTRGHEDLARIKNYVKSSNTFGWYEWSTKENVITTDLRSSPDCIYNGVAGSESVLDYLDLRKYRATRDVVALLRTVHLGTARTLDGALVLLNMARTDQVTKKAICDANGVKLLSKAFYPTVPARRQIALTIAITLVEILPYSSLSKSERTRKKAKCYGLVNKHANLSKIVSAKADNITTLGIKEEPTAYDCLDKQGSENSIRKIITLTSTGFALEEHLLCVQNEKGDYASKRKLFFWEDIDGFLRELEKGGDLPGEKVNAGFVSPWDEFQFKYSDGEFFSIRFGTYATRKILLDDAIDRIKRLRKDEAFIQGSIDTGLAVPRIRNPIFADNPQFLGVSVYHLQEHFLAALQKIEEFSSSSSFYELENLHKDSSFVRHVGQSTICPIDGEVGSAYVHTLFGEDHVGPATHVLSWTWR